MTVDGVAGEAMCELMAAALGTVVAVWRSGEVSAQRNLGFRHPPLPDGSHEEPLTSFAKDSRRWALSEIQGRIERALSSPRRI